MKKLILAVAILALTSTALFAQTKDARQDAREQKMAQTIDVMKAALATQNFTFLPSQMDLAYRGPIQLNNFTYSPYLDLGPTSAAVNLPYSLQNTPPRSRIFDLYMPSVPYKYSVKAGANNTMYVMVSFTNVSNQNANFMPMQTQSMNLILHFTINTLTGYTTMTLIPDFAAPITYTGTVAPN